MKLARLSTLRRRRLYPLEDKIKSIKKPKDTIGIRTYDLLASSAMPQPTAPLRTRVEFGTPFNLTVSLNMYQSCMYKDMCGHN
jgi:hypothetical protein